MTRTAPPAVAALAVAVAALSVPSLALAEARVALHVEGGAAAQVERAIVRGLESVATVVEESSGSAAIVLRVQLSRSGRRVRATLAATDAHGAALEQREVTTGPGPRGRSAIATAAVEVVRTATATLESREREAERARRRASRQAEERPEPEPDDEPAGERLAALASIGTRLRSLSIDLAEGVVTTHDSGLFTELGLQVRFHPLGPRAGVLRGLYAAFAGAIALPLSAADAMGNEVSANALRLRLDAGFSYPLGPADLGVALGFGVESLTFDETVVVPSTSYVYLRLGATGGYEILRDGLLHVGLAAGARLAAGTGGLADQYDGASAFAVDFALAATGHLGRLVYGLELALWDWFLGFDDTSADGMTAVSGSDLGFSATLSAGVQIW